MEWRAVHADAADDSAVWGEQVGGQRPVVDAGGPPDNKRGTMRIGACDGPVNLVPGGCT